MTIYPETTAAALSASPASNALRIEAAAEWREESMRARAANSPHLHIAAPEALAQKPVVELTRGDAVKIEKIDFIWPGYLARGKMHIFAGAPGTGKTTIALSLGATITVSGPFPDGARCARKGSVIVWSGEDDPGDTLAPRLRAMGADMERVHFVSVVREGDKTRPFDPSKDVEPLAEAVRGVGDVAMLVIDPIVSAVSGDSHKNAETRRGLQPLVELAKEVDAALVGITHLSKGTTGRDPLERITGSLAFGALARIVMVTSRSADEDGPPRLFVRVKSNIGPDGGGFGYDTEIQPVPGEDEILSSCITWREPLEGSAREILAKADASHEEEGLGDALSEAEEFLLEQLAGGPVLTNALKAAAEAHSVAWRTVERAKKSLEKTGVAIRAERIASEKGAPKWQWTVQHRQPLPTQNLGGLGGLAGEEGVEF
jgi:putative DNA primase/helicase